MTAKSTKELRGQGLSLYILRYPDGLKAFLYDGQTLLQNFLEILSEDEQEGRESEEPFPEEWEQDLIDHALNSVYSSDVGFGMIDGSWNMDCNAFTVELSAAEPGYGPFMYDVAGSVFKWIMSDRTNVSNSASYVWQWMFDHPEQYSKKLLVDPSTVDIEKGKPWKSDDQVCIPDNEEEALLYVYRSKANKSPRTQALVNN